MFRSLYTAVLIFAFAAEGEGMLAVRHQPWATRTALSLSSAGEFNAALVALIKSAE